ncbi:MAG TPA: hypothetical protein VGT41_00735 [Candidatus Babeliales bacterium]|nr:hypothetical protein [Candidatus Babeliales bacterium]
MHTSMGKKLLSILLFITALQTGTSYCTSLEQTMASVGKSLDELNLSTNNSLRKNISNGARLSAIAGFGFYLLYEYERLGESKKDVADIGMAYIFYPKKTAMTIIALIAAKLGYRHWPSPNLGYEIPPSHSQYDEIMKRPDIKKTVTGCLSVSSSILSIINSYHFAKSLKSNNFNILKATIPYGYLAFIINCAIRQLTCI